MFKFRNNDVKNRYKHNGKKIIDKKGNSLNLVLMTDQSLQDFKNKSNEPSNEYQMHYVNLVGSINYKGSMLNIIIPIVMYNYKQKVAGASIGFDLNDVEETEKKLESLILETKDSIFALDTFQKLIQVLPLTWSIMGLNSIHRHPTGLNRFSSTDLNKGEKVGVVFPIESCNTKTVNTAGIITHINGKATLVNMETRIVSTTPNAIIYEKGETVSYVKSSNNNDLNEIFYKSIGYYVGKDKELSDDINQIITLWDKLDFKVNTDNIITENVEKESFNRYRNHKSYDIHDAYTMKNKKGNHIPDYMWY